MLSKETIAEIEEAKKTSDVEYHQKMTDALSKHIIENWKCPNEHVLTTISAGYDGAVYMYCREGCIFHGYGSLLMQIPNEVSDDEFVDDCLNHRNRKTHTAVAWCDDCGYKCCDGCSAVSCECTGQIKGQDVSL